MSQEAEFRKALLVAASVNQGDENNPDKLSVTEFSEKAGVSVMHVRRYLHRWNRMAISGSVPPAATLCPADVDQPERWGQ